MQWPQSPIRYFYWRQNRRCQWPACCACCARATGFYEVQSMPRWCDLQRVMSSAAMHDLHASADQALVWPAHSASLSLACGCVSVRTLEEGQEGRKESVSLELGVMSSAAIHGLHASASQAQVWPAHTPTWRRGPSSASGHVHLVGLVRPELVSSLLACTCFSMGGVPWVAARAGLCKPLQKHCCTQGQ